MLALDKNCDISENFINDDESGDRFIGLTITSGAFNMDTQDLQELPTNDATVVQSTMDRSHAVGELYLIPYYFRGNRGGKGQMRVGLKPLKATKPSAGGEA
jgi:hypothetical protein